MTNPLHDVPVPLDGASALSLRSVDLLVPDMEAARRFYTAAWGLTEVPGRPEELVLRGTGADHHLLVLTQGPAALRSVTFRAPSREAVERAAAVVPGAGGRVLAAPGVVDWPGGGFGAVLADPRGRTWRLVHGDEHRVADAPVTGAPAADRPSRLSHVNVNSSATDADASFFVDALGFRLTDRSKMMAFVRCNSDHHAVVIADAAVDGLNHVAFMMPSLEGVMRGSGRMVDAGFPIGWGVGRHGPGDNVFAYFVDPFGIVVEYTAEVLRVDDSYRVGGPGDWTWPPGRTDHWGIAPPKSERVKQAQLAIGLAPAFGGAS